MATAPAGRKINLSPKGMDTFRILDDHTAAWLNFTGSGNETAAHLLEDNRMTVMFCSFDKEPLILRLYGSAEAIHEGDDDWLKYTSLFEEGAGKRQVFILNIDLVQSSCGYSIPKMEFIEERDLLKKWTKQRGEEGVREYWKEKNKTSLDGRPTGM